MGLFGNTQQGLTPEEKCIKNLNVSRYNILIVIALTLVNLIFLLVGSDTYFLFSASVPYYIVGITQAISPVATAFATVFAVAVLAAYFLCFLFGKKHMGWLIAALALFAIDTVFYLYLLVFLYLPNISEETLISILIELVMHFYALYYFIAAVISACRIKKAALTSE